MFLYVIYSNMSAIFIPATRYNNYFSNNNAEIHIFLLCDFFTLVSHYIFNHTYKLLHYIYTSSIFMQLHRIALFISQNRRYFYTQFSKRNYSFINILRRKLKTIKTEQESIK